MLRRGYADTPEGQIHYATAGEGEPLLILHSTPRSSRAMENLIPLLAKHYRVIAMDTLGCGNSAPVPPNATLKDLARGAVHLLDALQVPKCHVFGNHTGAKIAAEIAAEWPSRVDRLIMLGHSLLEPAEQVAVLAKRGARLARLLEPASDGSHLVREWAYAYRMSLMMLWDPGKPPQVELSPEAMNIMQRYMLDLLQIQASGPTIYKAVFTYDSHKRLPLIQAPTLLIQANSPTEPEFSKRQHQVTKLIKGSTVAILEGVNGNAPEWQPARVAEIIVNFCAAAGDKSLGTGKGGPADEAGNSGHGQRHPSWTCQG